MVLPGSLVLQIFIVWDVIYLLHLSPFNLPGFGIMLNCKAIHLNLPWSVHLQILNFLVRLCLSDVFWVCFFFLLFPYNNTKWFLAAVVMLGGVFSHVSTTAPSPFRTTAHSVSLSSLCTCPNSAYNLAVPTENACPLAEPGRKHSHGKFALCFLSFFGRALPCLCN